MSILKHVKILLFLFIATSTVCAQSDLVKVDIIFKDGTVQSGQAKLFIFSSFSSRKKIQFTPDSSAENVVIPSSTVDMVIYYWNEEPAFTLKRARHVEEVTGKVTKKESWYTVVKSCDGTLLLEYFEALEITKNRLVKLYEGGSTRLYILKKGDNVASIVGYGVYWVDKDRLYEGGIIAKYNSMLFNDFSRVNDGIDIILKKKEPISYSFIVEIFDRLCLSQE